MTAEELAPAAAAVVEALRDAGVRLDPAQLEEFQRRLAPGLWPLLDRASRLLVTEESIRQRLVEGRLVLVVDDAGSVRVWDGTDEAEEG